MRALFDLASRASSKNLVACFQNAALSALQPMVINLQTDLLGPGQTPVTYRRVADVVVRVADAKKILAFERNGTFSRGLI